MVFIYFLIGIIAVSLLLLILMMQGFRNTKKPHTKTPDEYGLPFNEIRIPTKNHRNLYAWWIPAETECTDTPATLILVHGWNRNVERMMAYIKELQPKGYNLLAFDSRNHGNSDSDSFSSMIKFAEDIQASVDYLENHPCVNHEKLGVIGLSIGGAASIYAAALDKRIKKVITVGAFARPDDVMALQFTKRHIPYIPFVWVLFKYVEFRIGAKFDEIAPVNNINKSKAEFLLIHGTDDKTVPYEQAKKLIAAANPDKAELFTLPERGHSDCHKYQGFWEKLEEFLL
jgi:pimeloyl-ACP methyl ester carboxylesterase